ncbi:MAG TPA: RNB domain-containing ribonuclease [Longimicrobiaceae bacterium]|nr:RNB domain-containing ribonuclease [Longimicrobiaceae bacterium]
MRTDDRSAPSDRRPIERAFAREREELGIRTEFPADVLAEAERAARERDPAASPAHADLTEVPFVTVDPPGSRDLDQALHLERAGEGLRLRYAIADVGFWVDRGGAVEREAWLRGVTYYAPDRRVPLYPPVLGERAASLLPDGVRPVVVFTVETDARAEPVAVRVERARVRSRAQLTYAQAQEHAEGGGRLFAGEPWGGSLLLLREFGEARRAREAERGGVSLPAVDQHVQQDAAARLGYELQYETAVPSEQWNAQVSLLAGHVAALRMLRAGRGILRVMPPPEPEAVERFRRAARALGFPWPEGVPYADFMRTVELRHPRLAALVWQARRVGRGADYAAFAGERPEPAEHAALAMPYAHATAPLRRLADRYVLDLLAAEDSGAAADAETLRAVADVMNAADSRAAKLERRAVDVAEAWTLRGCEGSVYPAVVLGSRGDGVEVQVEEPPVRAVARGAKDGPRPEPGSRIRVRLAEADVEAGEVRFEAVP